MEVSEDRIKSESEISMELAEGADADTNPSDSVRRRSPLTIAALVIAIIASGIAIYSVVALQSTKSDLDHARATISEQSDRLDAMESADGTTVDDVSTDVSDLQSRMDDVESAAQDAEARVDDACRLLRNNC
jgi:hypothetical protein